MRSLQPAVAWLALVLAASCGRSQLPVPVYREVVSSFYTGLAALQTSQDVLAREKLERVTELAPMEPAGWANLGVLEMRRGELDAARELLENARERAPESAAIERLIALAASQEGDLLQSIQHWERARELDPESLEAGFALAREKERLGGPGADAEAQRVLASLLERSDNLAVRLELARVAAKRGDREALERAVAPLDELAITWPPEAREQLEGLRDALSEGPEAAVPRVMFLRNVLLRVPSFRRALAEVTSEGALLGEPLERFLVLENVEPRPAPPDTALTFAIGPVHGVPPSPASWVGAIFLTGEEPPVAAMSGGDELQLSTGASITVPGELGWHGVAAADLDYDFRSDLVLAGAAGSRIFLRTEEGDFTDVTAATGLSEERSRGSYAGVWAADIDTDGDLDLVLARADAEPLVLRNNGDGTFAETSPFTGLSRLRHFAWGDLDGEGVPDAAVVDGAGALRIFLNLRGGELREDAPLPGVPAASALAIAEANGDAILDLLALTPGGSIFRIAYDPAARRFGAGEIARADLDEDAAGLITADLDNNGATDLVVAGRASSRVLLGGPDGRFERLEAVALSARAAADLDGDGRLELLGVGADGRAALATSRGGRSYRWQVLHPRATSATGDQRINSFGIGGEVELRTGLHFQKKLIDAPAVHFGIGEAERGEVVRIGWPNGVLQSEFELAANTSVLATQRLKGSCPWLFTWNGRDMVFVTDLIWRSPLGLRINAQETADVLMTEDRVKVGGDQLVARDGRYDLRVTSELWETQFFDEISLLVVDHPEGTEVWVDERFAVPPPELTPRVTGPVREMADVRDDAGRDVAAIVRARDGRHLDFAGRGAYQGITRDHFVTLELPEEAPREGPLWLIAQGWVHPTDSSINLAVSQGGHPPPRGLSLHVEEGGRFRFVRDDIGFPAGKDKTVLVNLTGLFPAEGRRRLRLSTNLEIFWDRLGWAAGRPDVEPALLRIAAEVAELRYRGFSEVDQPEPSAPERPRYALAGTAPRWRDLEGYHTRFGDVRELLRTIDDRYVIMNAGDEIRLLFPEAPPPRSGWVRDFLVASDGWVKDGDFNTTFSRTVLPLPTHASAAYDAAPRRLEDDPVFQRHPEDFLKYHTRYVSPERLREALAPGR